MNEYLKKIAMGIITIFFGFGAVWLANIDSRAFDDAEQKVKVINAVENSPTPEQKHRDRILDSVDKKHAMKIRQQRYDDNKNKDSLRAITDSIFLDLVKRQTVQIEQIKQQMQSN